MSDKGVSDKGGGATMDQIETKNENLSYKFNNIFVFPHWIHILLVLVRTVSARQIFWVPTKYNFMKNSLQIIEN